MTKFGSKLQKRDDEIILLCDIGTVTGTEDDAPAIAISGEPQSPPKDRNQRSKRSTK